jgi:hypothetical protein
MSSLPPADASSSLVSCGLVSVVREVRGFGGDAPCGAASLWVG